MSIAASAPVAVFHEHPDWFRPLFAELERRGIATVRVDAAAHHYDPTDDPAPYALVINRASPSAYLRGHGHATFHTLAWLQHLERIGTPIINGSRVYAFEISKARQLTALAELGIAAPRTRVINHASQAAVAAQGLRFPVLVKANIGGSGAGIVRFETAEALATAADADALHLGVDGIALVQECAPLRGGHITRVELLEGRFLYAINVYPADDSFNLCPADVCQTTDGATLQRSACALDAPKNGMRVEATTPPPAIIEACERIAAHVGLDIGGIEYLIDDRDGLPYIYDVNALSNFVADAERVVGFDPFARFVDAIERRLATAAVPAERV
jgi:glutathione synthase/RimK-type ligase-like ATP-grasp enzyme